MFTQNCCIKKNTKELRDKLKALGYKLNHGKTWGKYLACFKIKDTEECRFVATPEYDLKNMPDFKNAVDCGANEELFLAIAALRDDSDYMQWFVSDATAYWLQHRPCFDDDPNKDNAYSVIRKDKWHKATIEELIEHFKGE